MEMMFDGDELPVDRRAEGWAETTALALVATQLRFLDPGRLTARLKALSLGDVQLSALSYSGLHSRRTPVLIRRSDPELYQLALINHGRQYLEQAGRNAAMTQGDMVLYDSSLPFEAGVAAGGPVADSLVLQFPKKLLPLRPRQIDRLLAVPLSARNGVGRLLARLLRDMTEDAAGLTPQDRTRLQPTALELVSAVLAHHLDQERQLPHHTQQHVLFMKMSSFIRANLGREDLGPGSVAAAHQVSLRTVHRLFEQHGTTVAHYIRRQRLERVRSDLAASHLGHLPVHAIGARWGFTRPAAFSRVFRDAYGMPPGECRRLSLRGDVGTPR